ncbi:MAG TPA: chemotaxis response regulator protein-glutamate methylesterase [Candidatus Methanoperedens sp.]|nr:chemotaxis response regulator protein-glutamate methylesterase [Candidatus Methanoperedens sp.]
MSLRVLVVDDSAYHRRTLSRIIGAAGDFEVVGTATDGEEAIRKVVTLAPDLLTLDLEMPRMDGYTFLRWLMRTHPLPVLVVSSRESNKSVFRALELGAADFVLKPVSYASERLGQIEGELVAKLREIAAARPEKLAARAERMAARPGGTPAPRRAALAAGRYRCVAIGASTGGPPALQQILAALPADFPAAVVIAQHMPEGFTRMFADRLDRLVALRVREAAGGEALEPGLVLLAPGGMNLLLERAPGARVVARVEPPRPGDRYVPSVDRLLGSAARACGGALVAVVLTGMGDDGAAGIGTVRAAGGLTVAEAEETCVVYGMPREAVRTGAVQRVLPLPEIGAAIANEVLGTGQG